MMMFGFVKDPLDAHTLGIMNAAQLLLECGYNSIIADEKICSAVEKIEYSNCFKLFTGWIKRKRITHLGYSYRLDPQIALINFEKVYFTLKKNGLLSYGTEFGIKKLFFAGLPVACEFIRRRFGKEVNVFIGDETPFETLNKFGIPVEKIPRYIKEDSVYDNFRLDFGNTLIKSERYLHAKPEKKYCFKTFGTNEEHLIHRLERAEATNQLPLFRAHVGPYLPDKKKAVELFRGWLRILANERLLDIVSIGSSQLSQSHFGEDWNGLANGGGVPFNSDEELNSFWLDSRPMLVRAYSGTKAILQYAQTLEDTIHNAWHALSFWWFNQLDGRGPLDLQKCIFEHIDAIEFIARIGKPFEPNISHHFSFRGCDDVTYIVSAYVAAKAAKLRGIRYLILQNMLNTPKNTTGIMDLAKARALCRVVKSLEDNRFRVIYQPRAGLNLFSPNIEKAKAQLAAVTALMMDVHPERRVPPEIIHVVGYSEAQFLADPNVINESIQITWSALKSYREYRQKNQLDGYISGGDLELKTEELYEDSWRLIRDIEDRKFQVYSKKGLYKIFQMGYFPVPYLWNCREEFPNAVNWQTRYIQGGMALVNEKGEKISIQDRIQSINELNTDYDEKADWNNNE